MTASTNGYVEKAGSSSPMIVRAAIEKLTIYEISDVELLMLERGYPGSIYLNFAIFLLSVAVTFTVTLATTTISSERLFDGFFLVMIVGYALGLMSAILWFRGFHSSISVSETIRQRLRTEGVSQRIEGIMGIEPPPSEQLEILEATYGIPGATIDVTSQVRGMIKDNALRIVASNAIGGDPSPHKHKKLTIKYTLNQKTYYSEFLEGTEAVIPLMP